MFKKYAKSLLEKEVAPAHEDSEDLSHHRTHRFSSELPPSAFTSVVEEPHAYESEEPETIIGEKVVMKGELAFDKLLRVDGKFEGELISNGKIIIGPTGCVKANINMSEAFISGKVEGDINVKERLVLRGRAEICGNITAPMISVDEGVSIIGQMYVNSANKPLEGS